MRTYRMVEKNGKRFNILDLQNTNFFKLEIVNHMGSNIEKLYKEKHKKDVYGISHLIEHLSFKSPKDYTSEELQTILIREGDYNASTSFDKINYWFSTITEKYKTAIDVCCNITYNDLMGISLKEFQTERKVVYNECKQYEDNTQQMFCLDSNAIASNWDTNDNILGSPQIIEQLSLEDARRIKSLFINNDDIDINITYDSTKLNIDNIIDEILLKINEFQKPQYSVSYDEYESYFTYPMVGEFTKEYKTDQYLLNLKLDSSFNIITSDLGNMYLSYFAKNSISEIVREKHGLTYNISMHTEDLHTNTRTIISTDVNPSDKDKLMELIEESIDKSVEEFNDEMYMMLLDKYMLDEQMNLNAKKYNIWHYYSNRHPYVLTPIKDIISKNLDDGVSALIANFASKEKVKEYILRVQYLIKQKQYSKIQGIRCLNSL